MEGVEEKKVRAAGNTYTQSLSRCRGAEKNLLLAVGGRSISVHLSYILVFLHS